MNRPLTAVFAAVEALVAVGIGVGVVLVPLTLLWGIGYGLAVPWIDFWRAAGSIWLIGHGVDVTFVLDAATATASGLTGASAPIVITIAALGFAAMTAWFGLRAGRRLAETEHRTIGSAAAIIMVVALSVVIATTAISPASRPSLWQSILFPALWYGIPLIGSAELARRRRGSGADAVTAIALRLLDRIPSLWRAGAGIAIRGGSAVTAVVIAAAAVIVGFAVLGSYAEVITLYEQTHAGLVGGLAITIGQLAFLPDFVGWAASWIIGPGFAIGTGSSVSPTGTTLGPIPAVPLFGALPTHGHAFGYIALLVPVVGGFLAAAFLRPALVRALGTGNDARARALVGVGIGVVAGVLLGLAAWASSGAVGPGRLATVGPHPVLVGAFGALEVGVPAIIALAVGSDLVRLPSRETLAAMRVRDEGTGFARSGRSARSARSADDAAPLPADTMTTEDDGGFLGALDRAGAPVPTDVVGPGAGAGAGVGARAEAVTDVVESASAASRPSVRPDPAETQPSDPAGFPWRTEEFQARGAALAEGGSDPDVEDAGEPGAGERGAGERGAGERGVGEHPADRAADDWDDEPEVPEHELPWWRRPKS